MATLDDKLLGEKLHYYCSSSEEDSGDEEHNSDSKDGREKVLKSDGLKIVPDKPASDMRDWEGSSSNTGPKGVIRDWQRFKQLEAEKRENQEKERAALVKKLAATCTSHLDDEKEKQERLNALGKDDEADDEVLREFREKRMKELLMQEINQSKAKVFGQVFEITSSEEFLNATEKANELSIVMIYEERALGCASMKNCLKYLAAEYPHIKFCQVKASQVNLSSRFKSLGLPALLVYRNGELIGNYVQLVKEFGDEMYPSDVEGFLIEHGILQDPSLIPSALRS